MAFSRSQLERRLPSLLVEGQNQSREYNPVSRSVPLPVEDEVDVAEGTIPDIEFLTLLANETVLLGFVTWLPMPVTFALAWQGLTAWTYLFVSGKFGIVMTLQFYICHQIERALETHKMGSLRMDALDATWTTIRFDSVCGACAGLFQIFKFLVYRCFAFFEAVDSISGVMASGSAKQAFGEKVQQEFVLSWTRLPLVGSYAASCGAFLRLEFILAFGFIAISVWQFHRFRRDVMLVRQGIDSLACDARSHFFYYLFGLTDGAGLHILSSHMRHLWMATAPSEEAAYGGDRYSAYLSRVPEMVFQGWFSVTALGLVIDGPISEIAPLLVSVITTCGASIKSFYDVAIIIRPWSKYILSLPAKVFEDVPELPYMPSILATFMTIHLLGLLAIIVRLMAIYGAIFSMSN